MKPTRRQLLKGSLAAPLVLTARSASAWALTSAAACKIQDADKASKDYQLEKLCNSTDDEWLRCDVDICKLTVQQRKNNKWVNVDLPDKYYLGADKTTYWKVTESNGKCTADKSSYKVTNCSYSKTGEKKYGLCFVDDNCNQVGYCWEDYGGKCITKSCWWSINNSKLG